MAGELDLIKLRELYYKASVSREGSAKFAEAIENASNIDKATLNGYSGMSWMIKANHAINPYNKLAYFSKGKNLLEAAIKADAKNIELRFLRFCVQTNAPGFLNYRSSIITDKSIIVTCYSLLTDEDLKKRIKEYMLNSKECSEEEKQNFRK